MQLPRLVVVALLLLGSSGCIDSPVGSYRVDEAALEEASCTGIDQTRAAAWTAAMRESLIQEMQVGQEEGVAGANPWAQYLRADSTIFNVQLDEPTVTDDGNHRVTGTRLDDAVPVRDAGLGADFSALLEANDVGCEIEYRLDLVIDYRDGDWKAAISTLEIEVSQPFSSDHSCVVESCRAVYEVAALHTGGADPGLRGTDGG